MQEPDEDEEEDVDPKLEKALIIGSIAVALIIFIILIFLLGRFIGLWGSSSSETEPTPSPEATATVDPADRPVEGKPLSQLCNVRSGYASG